MNVCFVFWLNIFFDFFFGGCICNIIVIDNMWGGKCYGMKRMIFEGIFYFVKYVYGVYYVKCFVL